MKLDERFTVFGPDRERLVPGKSQVSFELIAGFHAVSAADCNVSATDGPQWILNVSYSCRARVISFFTVEHGKITNLLEFWPEPYAAAANRAHLVESM